MYPDDPEVELITVMDKKASLLTPEQQSVLWHDGYVIKKAQAVDWDESTNAIKVVEKKDLSTLKRRESSQNSTRMRKTLPGSLAQVVRAVWASSGGKMPEMKVSMGSLT